MKTREQWLRMARSQMADAGQARRTADWLAANQHRTDVPVNVWHAAHEALEDTRPCRCTPCTLARGETLSCL